MTAATRSGSHLENGCKVPVQLNTLRCQSTFGGGSVRNAISTSCFSVRQAFIPLSLLAEARLAENLIAELGDQRVPRVRSRTLVIKSRNGEVL